MSPYNYELHVIETGGTHDTTPIVLTTFGQVTKLLLCILAFLYYKPGQFYAILWFYLHISAFPLTIVRFVWSNDDSSCIPNKYHSPGACTCLIDYLNDDILLGLHLHKVSAT